MVVAHRGQGDHRLFRYREPERHRHRGQDRAAVFAAAAGKVVYAGTGLRGYGKLIIVKHNNSYLSAYAHNQRHPGQGRPAGDASGQKIAEMGNTDSDQVKLHFEIRRLGKPIDPLK